MMKTALTSRSLDSKYVDGKVYSVFKTVINGVEEWHVDGIKAMKAWEQAFGSAELWCGPHIGEINRIR